MRARGKIAAFAGAVALVSGLGVSAAVMPAGATVTPVGSCAGGSRAIAKIVPGLLPAKANNTISLKVIGGDVNEDGVSDGATSFGSCTFVGGPGVGTHTIAKFGAKVVGTTSCTPNLPADPADVIPSGKIGWGFTDLTATQAYASITGFKPLSTNVVNVHGIVTKGNGLGAFLDTQNAFLPVTKVKYLGAPGPFNLWNDGLKTEYDLDLTPECSGGTAGVPILLILVSDGGTSGANPPSFNLGTATLS